MSKPRLRVVGPDIVTVPAQSPTVWWQASRSQGPAFRRLDVAALAVGAALAIAGLIASHRRPSPYRPEPRRPERHRRP
jgi:hypothetical protein